MTQGEVLTSALSDDKFTNVGVVLDLNSRMGKEQKTAIEIAVESFNNENSKIISIKFVHFNQSLLQNAFAVDGLLKEDNVEVLIVGIYNWQATSLVAQIGSLAQVPILSIASSPPKTSPFPSLQWPFLVQLSHDATKQVRNIATIINSYHWRRVIVVYEDNSSSGTISTLTQALQNFGSLIEHRLVLPPFASIANDPRDAIRKELTKLDENYYSRVFIVLKISLPFVSPLFDEAKKVGLMRNDSIWITTETITNFIPSFDNPTLSSMEGVIGFMTAFDNSTVDFQVFEAKFGIKFPEDYEKEEYNEPSYEALLAYDAINNIIKAKQSLGYQSDKMATSKSLLEEILQSNFTGLSGPILFNQKNNNLLAKKASTKLVNIVGSTYRQVMDFTTDDVEDDNRAKRLASEVKWPGDHKGVYPPKGWKMPTYTKKLRIGVPIAHNYKSFIDYHGTTLLDDQCLPSSEYLVSNHSNDRLFTGYSIDIFRHVVKLLDYELPYELIPVNCSSYDVLINRVHDKKFDAAIGDISILANRSDVVDFTLPYAESGLSIILPNQKSNNSHGPWIFLKPFTSKMWFVTFFVFLHTMIVIWALERGNNNTDFRGPWKQQLFATAWFTFCSLYFAQRENVSTRLARVVVIMWLFIVLILTTSYTSNLTSMLTNERLNQTTFDINIMLQKTNTKVGLTPFVNRFLKDLLQFDPKEVEIRNNGMFEDFHGLFQANHISAACFEFLYAKLFLNRYCKQYTMSKPIHRFGGFGFVFPKGSPIAIDVSEAILNLTENGKLQTIEKEHLHLRHECISTSHEDDKFDDDENESSLGLESFRYLFYFSGVTTTVCLLASLIPLYAKYRRNMRIQQQVAPVN